MRIADNALELDTLQNVLSLAEDRPGQVNAQCVADGLSEACFTEPFFWKTYQAAKQVCRHGHRADIAAVSAVLGQESRQRLLEIWPAIPVLSNYRLLCSKLREYAARRAAHDIGRRIMAAAEDTAQDPTGHLTAAAAALQGAYGADGTHLLNGNRILLEYIEELERLQSGGNTSSVETGIQAWDDNAGGVQRGVLTALGSCPGVGKTAIAATIAYNCAARGIGIGYFSLEDRPHSLAKRFISRETGITLEQLTSGRLNGLQLESLGAATNRVKDAMERMTFDMREGLTGAEVAATARFMAAEKDCKLIIVDLLTEVRATTQRKERSDLEVAESVGLLRDVAKSLNIPVLLLAHLSRPERGGEEAIYRVPSLTSFADSSNVEKRVKVAVGIHAMKDHDFIGARVLKRMDGPSNVNFYMERHTASGLIKNVCTRRPHIEEDQSEHYNA